MVCIHLKFYVPGYKSSLVIIKHETKFSSLLAFLLLVFFIK